MLTMLGINIDRAIIAIFSIRRKYRKYQETVDHGSNNTIKVGL